MHEFSTLSGVVSRKDVVRPHPIINNHADKARTARVPIIAQINRWMDQSIERAVWTKTGVQLLIRDIFFLDALRQISRIYRDAIVTAIDPDQVSFCRCMQREKPDKTIILSSR